MGISRFNRRQLFLTVRCPIGAVGTCHLKARVTLADGVRVSAFATVRRGRRSKLVRLNYGELAAPSSKVELEVGGRDDGGPLAPVHRSLRAPWAITGA